jgi:uncharacterized membrane protein
MQGIYTHIPQKNRVPKQYNVAAILSLLFMVPISLAAALALMYFYISTFRSTCAVSNTAVFCSSLTSWFPGMVLTYFLNDFEMVPVAPIITGITLVFTYYYYDNDYYLRPVVTYSSETWTLTAKDENNLRISERQILRKIFCSCQY